MDTECALRFVLGNDATRSSPVMMSNIMTTKLLHYELLPFAKERMLAEASETSRHCRSSPSEINTNNDCMCSLRFSFFMSRKSGMMGEPGEEPQVTQPTPD